MTLLKFLPAVAVLALLFGVASILFMFRARAMRAFAARWCFQYIGPAAPKGGFPAFPKIRPPLSVSFPLAGYPADQIRQIWNVIEGQQNGVSVLIFDSVFGKGKGTYSTFIACQTEQNPTLQIIPWTMGTQRLDDHLNKLRVGSVCEPSC